MGKSSSYSHFLLEIIVVPTISLDNPLCFEPMAGHVVVLQLAFPTLPPLHIATDGVPSLSALKDQINNNSDWVGLILQEDKS